MQSLYGNVSDDVVKRAKKIKLFVCDIDGVFSDGRIYLGNDGEELKAFHTKDGYGMKALVSSGVKTAVITGRTSKIVENRMSALLVSNIIQGQEDKLPALKELITSHKLSPDEVAYIGDDMPDVACIEYVGMGISVADAHPYVTLKADYTTFIQGGFGAVREVCDLIMQVQNTLEQASGASI